jgi:hypothetical protein
VSIVTITMLIGTMLIGTALAGAALPGKTDFVMAPTRSAYRSRFIGRPPMIPGIVMSS